MNTVEARTRGQRPSWRTVAMITVVGLLGFAPVSASASDEPGEVDETEVVVQLFSEAQCSNGVFCVWSATSYLGTFSGASSTVASSTGFTTGRSVWNRSGRAARVFSGTGGTGSWVCYVPGAKVASISVPARSSAVLSGSSC